MERRPKRRGSMKRTSRWSARVSTAWVCGGWGTSGGETSRRPVMPRWMRNSVAAGFFCLPRSTVITMVLPTRRTLSMVAPVRTSAISASGDLKVCGLPLVHTLAMRWPWTRAWTPLAMVSTSGSSGMAGGLQCEVGGDVFGCVARQPQQRGDVTLCYRAEAIAAAAVEERPFFRRELLDGVKNLLGRQGVDPAIKAGDGCCGHTQLGFRVNAGVVDEVVERVAQQDVCVKAKLGAHGISLSTGLRSGKRFESQYKMRCTKRLAWVRSEERR